MNDKLTVIMYHYVRDLKNSRYPMIKGLDSELFIEQIEYLIKNYNPVSMEQVIDAYRNKTSLPSKAVLLTFDDGYVDHFTTVFPILKNRGLQGSFFAPIKALTQNRVLDVNKIHFILASENDGVDIILEIKKLLVKYKAEFNLKDFAEYYKDLAIANRFDSETVIFIKRLLQVALPVEARMKMLDELFEKIVGINQNTFSRELYMNKEQLQCMVQAGMHVGSHGYDHFWLSSLSKENQRIEIELSVEFVKEVYGSSFTQWTICFPYGNYNNDTLELLKDFDCAVGFSTEVRVANLASDEILTLPRLDTNDIPKEAIAPVNNWYELG